MMATIVFVVFAAALALPGLITVLWDRTAENVVESLPEITADQVMSDRALPTS